MALNMLNVPDFDQKITNEMLVQLMTRTHKTLSLYLLGSPRFFFWSIIICPHGLIYNLDKGLVQWPLRAMHLPRGDPFGVRRIN